MLDVFHMQQICGNLTNNLTDVIEYVGHVQIAQVPQRNEPDTPGEINYQYILETLQQYGYDDWIGLEYKPKSSTLEGLKWVGNFGYSLWCVWVLFFMGYWYVHIFLYFLTLTIKLLSLLIFFNPLGNMNFGFVPSWYDYHVWSCIEKIAVDIRC